MTCTFAKCVRPQHARGLCAMHWKRQYRHGDPSIVKHAPKGAGYIRSDGYRTITVDGKQILEHRAVIEKVLGRKLKDGEDVRHRDENKLNNAPENLEVLSPWAHHKQHARLFRSATHKQCCHCQTIKPRTAFSPHYRRSHPTWDPHTECKDCHALNELMRRLGKRKLWLKIFHQSPIGL